jgi:menaquinone reductase, molybdopterin-binding-like subunit
MLTPIPWRVLDDSAKWTQNWPWTPTPRKGSITYNHTTCTLCPMACGVRIRCIGNQPVSLAGVPGHPVNNGSLCAMGLAGHLLRYHPARLLQPYRRLNEVDGSRMVPISIEEAIAGLAKRISNSGPASVAILDMQPERTISSVYRRFLARLGNGVYAIPSTTGGINAGLTNAVLRTADLKFGFDASNARTVISFGSPVLDGWGTPGQFSEMMRSRRAVASERLRIIQVESAYSRTARLGDEWVPVKPGTEAAFALGLANVIINERLCDSNKLAQLSSDFRNGSGRSFVDLVGRFSPADVSGKTGIPAERIARIARELVSRKPSLAIFGGNSASGPFSYADQLAFMDLNILLGAVGTKGGLVAPREIPGPFDKDAKLADKTLLAEVPDNSIGLLILDGADSGDALPWTVIRRKLRTKDSIVISLASHLAGAACRADYVLPSPAYMEAAGDSPTPASAASASYSISTVNAPAPVKTIQPLDFVKRLDAAIHTHADTAVQSASMEQLLRARMDRIYSERRGMAFDATSGKVSRLSAVSQAAFREILGNGGCWFDETPARLPAPHYSFLGGTGSNFESLLAIADRGPAGGELVLIPVGTRGTGTIAQENVMMSKLYRESDLRTPADTVSVNPDTARKNGLADGAIANVRTEAGSHQVKVRFDTSIMPGVLEASAAPSPRSFDRTASGNPDCIIEICKIESDSTWRMTTAQVTPA